MQHSTSNIQQVRCRGLSFDVGRWVLNVGCSRCSQRGVALIITVILLAVVLLMALTFLAVSRRERSAVTTTTDTATAKLAADDALAAAEAQIMANTLATTNPYNFGLLVSTNYINTNAFLPGVASYTNVNYYYKNGTPVVGNDFLQLLANSYYLPRAPVYATNYLYHTNELQFYLDLNRNGRDDTNGWVTSMNGNYRSTSFEVGDPEWIGVLQHPDQPYGPNNLYAVRYAFVAVPIGNALDLNQIYNQTLDAGLRMAQEKYIQVNPPPVNGGFLRNQGVGPWEINLAAFLADLNTNEWGRVVGSGQSAPIGSATYYQYNQPNNANFGHAFDDARALLAYRYDNNYMTLQPANHLFPDLALNSPVFNVFPYDNIDEYSDGPLQTTFDYNESFLRDNPILPWAGAPNTNHFFDLQELYNTSETEPPSSVTPPGFTDRLLSAGTNYSTYDRYTYYRLLSQMGVDSAPEQGQINLNYSNALASFNDYGVVTNISYYPGAETNLVPWNPLQFFTIAADRMLRAYSQEWITESPSNYVVTYGMTTNLGTYAYPTNVPVPFGITNIPVVISNRFVYTPAIQRVLQLAANIYDATTNTATLNTPDYPSVFRPIFNLVTLQSSSGVFYTNVYIAGYEPVGYDGEIGAVAGPGDYQLALPVNVADLLNPSSIPYGGGYTALSPYSGIYTNVNVYGVPWIIGAKKGFPNFNEFAMESTFQLGRKVQVTRPTTNSPSTDYSYNQMFLLSLSNQFGVECWNSYTNDYLRSVAIYVRDSCTGLLTNNEGCSTPVAAFMPGFLQINPASYDHNGWPGYNPHSLTAALFRTTNSFQIPLETNVTLITNSVYRFNRGITVAEPGFIPGKPYLTTNLNAPFESDVVINGNRYPQPHWWLTTTNNLQVIILDTPGSSLGSGTGLDHIIDYVQLSGPNSVRDLTSEIISNYDVPVVSAQASGGELWNTNFQAGVPIGILSQVQVSLNHFKPSISSGTWDTSKLETQNGIDGFRAFYHLSPIWNNPSGQQEIAAAYMTNFIQTPYNPTATMVQEFDWQANDPLVHYMYEALQGPTNNGTIFRRVAEQASDWPLNLGLLNTQYRPWGGYPSSSASDPTAYNLAIKDPLVWQSDDWDFPTYKFPTVGWLGRVHRGTPWQTVYLKSANILEQTNAARLVIGTNTWAQWTGDSLLSYGRYYDAVNTAPVQDWLLFDLFTTAPDANATRGQLSVNVDASNPSPQAGLAAWSALFSGVQVLHNSAPDSVVNPATASVLQHNGTLADYTAFPVNPAGPVNLADPPALWQIVTNINGTRANFLNLDGLKGTFEHVGDILSVPDLSDASPFLNKDVAQQYGGISDEMYEWLPQQVMSLLRVSGTPQSPMRYVIYCYGQALKPAPGGIYTGGATIRMGNGGTESAFGMVTNYQVVAESATRAVVNFGSVVTNMTTTMLTNSAGNLYWSLLPHGRPVVTNNTAQIEQFNVLPPY